jgi:hypothetical protein
MSIEWKEGGWGQELPTAVINIELNGRKFVMDLITYNENIERGKTKFVTYNDTLIMVSEADYIILKSAHKNK